MAGIFEKLFGRKQKIEDEGAPPALTQLEQIKLGEAERLITIINESMQFFKTSENLETRISRLHVASDMVRRLREITIEYPFIKIDQLNVLESQISELFAEQMPEMQRVATGNMDGEALEKEGKIDEAIEVYEALATSGTDTPYTYRRLAILCRKKKERAREILFVEMALKNVPAKNATHYAWFEERLAKLNK